MRTYARGAVVSLFQVIMRKQMTSSSNTVASDGKSIYGKTLENPPGAERLRGGARWAPATPLMQDGADETARLIIIAVRVEQGKGRTGATTTAPYINLGLRHR